MSSRFVAVITPFEDLTDPRVERTREHELFDLVVSVPRTASSDFLSGR